MNPEKREHPSYVRDDELSPEAIGAIIAEVLNRKGASAEHAAETVSLAKCAGFLFLRLHDVSIEDAEKETEQMGRAAAEYLAAWDSRA
ncbi:hypothetical protein GOB93_07630 [Acetobacter musti]|uniref:Uncharacterized protein n=1 Tax=Acetobacter musti TaxID=864732 RepID=A0ABX0JP15_9PROT|nr:hypothetical protein [Acetobacter musti]NHN84514.1 hypothetical protein [Acetobacter musti]